AALQPVVADGSQPRRLRTQPRPSVERARTARRGDDAADRRGRGRTAPSDRRADVPPRSRGGRASLHPVSIEHRPGGIADMIGARGSGLGARWLATDLGTRGWGPAVWRRIWELGAGAR